MTQPLSFFAVRVLVSTAALATLSACSSFPQWTEARALRSHHAPPTIEALAEPRERPDMMLALTDDQRLVAFVAGSPGQIISQTPVKGLRPGELIESMDFRVSRSQLWALTNAGRLLRVDPATGAATPVGMGVRLPPQRHWSMDNNPATDRLRLVSDEGGNLQVDPESGAQIDGDPATPGIQPDQRLSYARGDLLAGRQPRIVAIAHTEKPPTPPHTRTAQTTLYAIDMASAHLVVQGSIEGAPVVSPDTGVLQSIGPLLTEHFDRAALDLGDAPHSAYLVTSRQGATESRLYALNLGSGQARLIGSIGIGKQVRALAVVP